jgi:hypothetical protein
MFRAGANAESLAGNLRQPILCKRIYRFVTGRGEVTRYSPSDVPKSCALSVRALPFYF